MTALCLRFVCSLTFMASSAHRALRTLGGMPVLEKRSGCLAKIKRKMKKSVLRVFVLAVVFLIALGGYFAWSFLNTEKEFTVYTSMEEPKLPVVYAEINGVDLNAMHGYMQDMGSAAASDSVTVLPADRKLPIRIETYGNMIAHVSYEIRSLDRSHFIEKTDITDFETAEDGSVSAVLPIQNLINENTQYLLNIQIDTGENTVNYYTRILWTERDDAVQMIAFADNFTRKTFDYNAARELASYLETSDTAANDDLGEVNITSSFSQLTWGSTGMKLATGLNMTMREYSGIMGEIEVSYMTERQNELGQTERYQVTDDFTMRMGSERIYLMDYQRRTDQIFEGNKHLFAGKQIDLGIASDGMLQSVKSENGQYLVYKVDRELWTYDQKSKRAVNIFSFRSGEDDGVRANYDHHDIKILSVENNGDIDFVVYGYMNRGRHEGYNGLSYYRYSRSNDTITENFFIPMTSSFDKIRLELEELCKKGNNDMFYLKQNGKVTAIDLRSLEMLDVVSGLSDGTYAVSADQSSLAWLDGEAYRAKRIKYMDLETGNTRTIDAADGEFLRVIGFSGRDLIYGRAGANDQWLINNRTKGFPMQRIEIVNEKLEPQKTYEKEGLLIDGVNIEGNRIHLGLYARGAEPHSFAYAGEDTIVSNGAKEDQALGSLSYEQSKEKQKVWYVRLDQEIKTTRSLKVSVPRKISYENAGTIELSKTEQTQGKQMQFYAYAGGRLLGTYTSLAKAVNLCYEKMGWVTDANGILVYNRADRDSLKTISDPMHASEKLLKNLEGFSESHVVSEDSIVMLDAQGLKLNQVLYYVGQGIPAAAFRAEGDYILIYGYDNFNISIYQPNAPEGERKVKMGRGDAETYFDQQQFDFICAVNYGS